MTLILASKSLSRQTMLRNTGLEFETCPADIDERQIQSSGLSASKLSQSLACEKALAVSQNFPDALVIGSDQILSFESRVLHKARNKEQAKEKLKSLRGKTHHLISAVSVVKTEKILWQDAQTASLTMFDFSDDYLSNYLEKAGDALTRAVGAYELESSGIHLFEKIEGDYFTILGMPLLPLLKYLRTEHGVTL